MTTLKQKLNEKSIGQIDADYLLLSPETKEILADSYNSFIGLPCWFSESISTRKSIKRFLLEQLADNKTKIFENPLERNQGYQVKGEYENAYLSNVFSLVDALNSHLVKNRGISTTLAMSTHNTLIHYLYGKKNER